MNLLNIISSEPITCIFLNMKECVKRRSLRYLINIYFSFAKINLLTPKYFCTDLVLLRKTNKCTLALFNVQFLQLNYKTNYKYNISQTSLTIGLLIETNLLFETFSIGFAGCTVHNFVCYSGKRVFTTLGVPQYSMLVISILKKIWQMFQPPSAMLQLLNFV